MSDQAAADFLRDQLEALLASPALARHAEPRDEPAASEPPSADDDSESAVDAQLLREALRAGLNQ
ncbi:MAG TPA: hypothetical protein VHM25_06110 [Polyangiaceae bacterium]|jgi:hypothetical protein|nr:hypothetical protein [Polyangiaceae bacterium]